MPSWRSRQRPSAERRNQRLRSPPPARPHCRIYGLEFARAYDWLLAQRVEAKDRPLFAELFRVRLPDNEAAALLGKAEEAAEVAA